MTKKNQLQTYSNTIFKNVNTSKYDYKTQNEILQLKIIRLHISKLNPNKTHFLYIYLLVNKKLPHLHNFYIPQKFRYQKQRIRRRHGISLFLNKKTIYTFISKLLMEIIPFSSSTENEALKKIKNFWKITIWQAPLTNETYPLQSLHGYISPIPLTVSFHFNNSYIYQHLTWFSFFKIIHHTSLVNLNENNNNAN